MNTIKAILYIITFLILGKVAFSLVGVWYTSVTHLSWYTATGGEINYIIAAMLELIIIVCILFFFFIPLWRDWEKENIFYLVDTMASSINDVINNWNDHLVRKEKGFVLMTNSISYIWIIAFYTFLIYKIATETNWLKAVLLLWIILIFVKLIDFVNNIIKQLDDKSKDKTGIGWSWMDTLKKKLLIIIFLILLLMFFAYSIDWILEFFYEKLNWVFSFLDWNRQLPNK